MFAVLKAASPVFSYPWLHVCVFMGAEYSAFGSSAAAEPVGHSQHGSWLSTMQQDSAVALIGCAGKI